MSGCVKKYKSGDRKRSTLCAHYINAAGEVTAYPSQFATAYFLAANNKDCLHYQSCFHLFIYFPFFPSWFSKRATLIYWPNI